MKLSEKEIAQAEKYLADFEKTANSWRWVRWFLLTFSVALIMLVPWYLHKAKEAYELNQTEGLLAKLGPKSEILEKYVEMKIGLLRAEFDYRLKVGVSFYRWRRSAWLRYRSMDPESASQVNRQLCKSCFAVCI